jgi:type IV pilus modification protein PilV
MRIHANARCRSRCRAPTGKSSRTPPVNRDAAKREPRSRQRGAFLLEALVGIAVFALGVLGIVGLLGLSLRAANDSQYRAEAAYLASSLMSRMWTDERATLESKYDSRGDGAGYAAFAAEVKSQLGAAWTHDPQVEFDAAKAPSAQSSYVQIVVEFMLPGTTCASPPCTHRYVTTGVIGRNR